MDRPDSVPPMRMSAQVSLYVVVLVAVLLGRLLRRRLWARLASAVVLVGVTAFIAAVVETAPRIASEKYGPAGPAEVRAAWEDGSTKTALVVEEALPLSGVALVGLAFLALVPFRATTSQPR
jgi:hypothetical protein